MKISKILRVIVAQCLLAFAFATLARAHDAKIVKLSGAVLVQLPGESAAKPATDGMALPEGTVITTTAGGEVYVETFPGAIATIKPNSNVTLTKLALEKQGDTITSQEALLDLKKGNVISTLDPTKKAINHYGVRTPKGVAAARGTVYGVSVNIDGTSVATLSGSVTLNLGKDSSGNDVFVTIPVGSAAMNDSSTISTINAALARSGQSITAETLLTEAVQAVATNVANNLSAVSNPGTATAVLAAVVNAASAASPSQAASFTTTAITAVVASGSSTSGENTATALAAVTEAAGRAAPDSLAAVTKAAVAVVTSSSSTTASDSKALAAVVEGATRSDPAKAQTVAGAAAAQVVETKVTEAVTQAKSEGKSDADVAAAAQTATTNAQAAVQQVAESTFAVAAGANGVQPGSPEAAALASSISSGATTGASTGASDASTTTNTPPPATTPTANIDATVVPAPTVTPSTPAPTTPAPTTPAPGPTNPPPSTDVKPPLTPVDLPPPSPA